jgi:hypothetical protein
VTARPVGMNQATRLPSDNHVMVCCLHIFNVRVVSL